jgi:hypothetical protein
VEEGPTELLHRVDHRGHPPYSASGLTREVQPDRAVRRPARDLQLGDGQWTRGKSLDAFCPLGPMIVAADQRGDAGGLAIRCTMNRSERKSARTSQLYLGVAQIIGHSISTTTSPSSGSQSGETDIDWDPVNMTCPGPA